MAFSEVKTGKIQGAKPGSLTYFHEEGHIIFNRRPNALRWQYWREHLPIYAVIFLSLDLIAIGRPVFRTTLKVCALAAVLLFIAIYESEEIWCWKYALIKRKMIREKLTHG